MKELNNNNITIVFETIPEYLLTNRCRLIKETEYLLSRMTGRKERFFDGAEIYQRVLIKIAEGKRKWHPEINADIQYKNMARSIAFSLIKTEKRRRRKRIKELRYEQKIERLPVVKYSMPMEALRKLKNWLNFPSNRELKTVYKLDMLNKTNFQISQVLNCSIRRVRHYKERIKKKLASF